MFEQSFVDRPAVRTGWSVLISFLLQTAGLVVAALVPLLNPELLPRLNGTASLRLAPPPGKPPAPPKPRAAPPSPTRQTPSQVFHGRLLLPPRIPSKVEMVVDELETQAVGDYVGEEGVHGGIGTLGTASAPSVIAQAVAPAPPPAAPAVTAPPKDPVRIKIGGDVQRGSLIHEVKPAYPPLARQARVEGRVAFRAVISAQGQIVNLQLVSGHPLLAPAAAAAIRQWRYRPHRLNGDPVEVDTYIEVTFRLQH